MPIDDRLMGILPNDLPRAVAGEVLTAFGTQAVVMFALHNREMAANVFTITDATLKAQGVSLTTREFLNILVEGIVKALQEGERSASASPPYGEGYV